MILDKPFQKLFIPLLSFSLLAILPSFSHAVSRPSGPYTVRLSDKQKIYLLIDLLRQGVKQQKAEKIAQVMAPDFVRGSKSLGKGELKEELSDLFANSEERRGSTRFKALKPVGMEVSSTWDFEIRNVDFHLRGNGATVDCDLLFWAASPDLEDKDYPAGRRVRETFLFSKRDDVWRLSRADKFLNFLQSYGEVPLDEEDERASDNRKPKGEGRKAR